MMMLQSGLEKKGISPTKQACADGMQAITWAKKGDAWSGTKKMNVLFPLAKLLRERPDVHRTFRLVQNRHSRRFLTHSMYNMAESTAIPEKAYCSEVLRTLSVMLRRGNLKDPEKFLFNTLQGPPGLGNIGLTTRCFIRIKVEDF